MKDSAILFGVSVGPGDPELMTIKAVKIIEQTKVIAVPRTMGGNSRALAIVKEICDLQEKELIYMDFLMSGDQYQCRDNYERLADTLESYLEHGQNVAMITLGDISVYSTAAYILKICQSDGYPVEWIPGVSSFQAAAARIGRPLVNGEESLIITNSTDNQFEKLMQTGTNYVIMKSPLSREEVAGRLNNSDRYEISAVTECGTDREMIQRDSWMPAESGYFTTILCNRIEE